MLARSTPAIPAESALPGGCRYEPKWDGVRIVAITGAGRTTLWSRRGTDLTTAFADLAHELSAHVPDGSVLDGEAVVWNVDRLDFTALVRRIAARASGSSPVGPPAHYVAFDVLALAGTDLRSRPLDGRREELEELAAGWSGALTLTPQTDDVAVASDWFTHMAAAGIEGLVAKGASQPYQPGRRGWLKVKRRTEVDVVCAAVLGPITAPTSIVAGLRIDGELRIVGRTVPLHRSDARDLARLLTPGGPGHSWPDVVRSATLSGFGRSAGVALTKVEPLVVEVSADAAWSGTTFRHPLRYLRARPDADPAEVRLPQRTGPTA